jgi:hypothetical protein
VLRATLAAALAALAFCGPVEAATVVFAPEGITPAEVTIPPTFSVTWVNTTTFTLPVASSGTPSFRPFTLGPGESVTIPFNRVGRYRYLVNDFAPGVVNVRTAAAPPRDRRGRSGACDWRRTYRYTIAVQGEKRSQREHGRGTLTTSFRWRSLWRNAPVTVDSTCHGDLRYRLVARGAVATAPYVGTVTEGQFAFENTDEPCSFTAAAPSLGIDVRLEGFGTRTGRDWTLAFHSLLDRAQAPALDAITDAVHLGACPEEGELNRPIMDAYSGREARRGEWRFTPPTAYFDAGFSTQQRRARPTGPIDSLIKGRSFVVATGTQRSTGTASAGETTEWSVTYRFTRVR